MTEAIYTINYDTWNDFKKDVIYDLYGTHTADLGRFIFRGQSDAEWSLISAFDRKYKDKAKASILLTTFEDECKRTGLNLDAYSLDELPAVAQHYGLPTRLLDWTKSLYIAVFFAASETIDFQEQGSFAIWAIDSTDTSVWSKEYGVEIMQPKSFGNERMGNQYGLFTNSKTTHDTLEQYAESFPNKKRVLYKLVISWSHQQEILADLGLMGINFSRVYPDFLGCAKAAETLINLKQ